MERAPQQPYAPAPGMEYAPQQPYAPAPGMDYVPQQPYAPAPGMEYAPQQAYAPAPGMEYAPQQPYAPAPGMDYVPQQAYAPAPGMDYVPQQAYAPAPGMGYPSMQQNREAALQKLLQQDPSLIHDPAISLLLQQSQSAPSSMPASISTTAQNGPWQQSPQGGELAALRASIKYCPVCGSALPWEAVFCGTCGTHLN